MKRWNCPVSQWAFLFTFTPHLMEGRLVSSKTNIGITSSAKRREAEKKELKKGVLSCLSSWTFSVADGCLSLVHPDAASVILN